MVEKKPLVSVIIPCFNGEIFIGEAIESVITQTYHNWELIIIDDSSTDNSKGIIQKYAAKEKRIKFVQNERNRGIPSTRNIGIKFSQGEYIAFLDQDDLWFDEKLSLFVKEFIRNDETVGIIFSDVEYEYSENRKTFNGKTFNYGTINELSKKDFLKKLFLGNFIKSPSQVVLRKECFEKIGYFDEQLSGGDDYDFWLRAAGEYKFLYLDTLLTKYRFHKNNSAKKLKYLMIEDALYIIIPKILKKYPFLAALKNKKFSNLYYDYGVYLCEEIKFKDARKIFTKSLKENIFNWKSWIRLLFSYINYYEKL